MYTNGSIALTTLVCDALLPTDLSNTQPVREMQAFSWGSLRSHLPAVHSAESGAQGVLKRGTQTPLPVKSHLSQSLKQHGNFHGRRVGLLAWPFSHIPSTSATFLRHVP